MSDPNVVCTTCGASVNAPHACAKRLSFDELESVIDDLLDDLDGRSGYAMTDTVRGIIRAEWIAILRDRFVD